MEGECIIDYGFSLYMSPRREWFHYFRYKEGVLLLGDNKEYKIEGTGSNKPIKFDGCIREVKVVRFVLELKRNLILVGTLDSHGCSIKIEGRVIKVIKKAITLMKGNNVNWLYVLNGRTIMGESTILEQNKFLATQLWHHRVGI